MSLEAYGIDPVHVEHADHRDEAHVEQNVEDPEVPRDFELCRNQRQEEDQENASKNHHSERNAVRCYCFDKICSEKKKGRKR